MIIKAYTRDKNKNVIKIADLEYNLESTDDYNNYYYCVNYGFRLIIEWVRDETNAVKRFGKSAPILLCLNFKD